MLSIFHSMHEFCTIDSILRYLYFSQKANWLLRTMKCRINLILQIFSFFSRQCCSTISFVWKSFFFGTTVSHRFFERPTISNFYPLQQCRESYTQHGVTVLLSLLIAVRICNRADSFHRILTIFILLIICLTLDFQNFKFL